MVTVLMMCCVFRAYYSYKKQKWEIRRLHRILQRDRAKTNVVVDVDERDNVLLSDPPKDAIKVEGKSNKRWNPEPFNDLLQNAVGVQDLVVDEIVKVMETEGNMNIEDDHREEGVCGEDKEDYNIPAPPAPPLAAHNKIDCLVPAMITPR